MLVLSQTAMPTAAYAKGFSSFHSSSSHRDESSPSEADNQEGRRIFGLLLLGGGVLVTGMSVNRIQERSREDSGE